MSAQSLVGRLLIALPKIEDPRFKRSVVLICAHSHDHAMGIALNRIVDELTLSELLDQMGLDGELAGHRHVLHGGPVGRGRGFVLHSEDYDCAGATLSVTDGVCMTATRDILHEIASDNPPEKFVMALGYSGWGPGQLEYELSENVWLIGNADQDIVYGEDIENKWIRSLELLGITPDRLHIEGGRA